jgi:hypothetical protein
MLIPKWKQTLFGNGESPNGNFFVCLHVSIWGLPIWKRRSPNGKHSHMGIFSSIPKWAQTLFGNGLVTEPVPVWKRDVLILLASMRHAQPNGKIVEIFFLTRKLDFLTGKSVFLARKSIFLTRKQLFHAHNLTTCSNFFAKFFQPQNRDSPFPFEDVPSPVFIWGSPYGNGDSFF